MEYKRILIAIDDTEESFKAADHAISIAKKFNSRLFAITVFDIPDIYFLNPETQQSNRYYLNEYIQNVNNRLQDIKNKALELDLQIETKILDEKLRPERSIIYYANENKIDLIVIGKGKRGNIKEWILGSTSIEVIKESECTVMLVK